MAKAKIMIVEDESIVALDLKQQLQGLGYEVPAICATGKDAVIRARDICPDLILMDIKLRGEMDGIETAGEILKEADIPIIYLTAFTDEETVLRAQATGAMGYLLKPYQERDLEINTVMALYRHSLERRLRENEEKWRSLVSNAPSLIMMMDRSGKVQFVNHCWFGGAVTDEYIERLDIQRFLTPDSYQTLQDGVARIFESGQPEQFEVECNLPGGKHIWLDTHAGPVVIGGRVESVTLIAADITPRIEMAQALASSLRKQKRANAFLSALSKVSTHLQQKADPEIVLDTLGSELQRMGLNCLVLLLNSQGSEAEVFYASVNPEFMSALRKIGGPELEGQRLPRELWKHPEVYTEGKSLYITNPFERILSKLPFLPGPFLETYFKPEDRLQLAMALMPMITANRVTGSIAIIGRDFYEEDMTALEIFGNQVTIALENARLFKQTQQISITDPLTGIYNRRAFLDMANREHERWTRYHHPYCLLMLDLDHFKLVNDTYGHLTGDRVLVATAQRLRHLLRKFDIFSRYGGEEFLAILPETLLPEAQQIAERLCQTLVDTTVNYGGEQISVTASFGVTQVDDQVESLESLIQRVDRALYQAKNAGRACVRAL